MRQLLISLKENRQLLIVTALALAAGILIGVFLTLPKNDETPSTAVSAMELVSVGPNTALSTHISFTGCEHKMDCSIGAEPYIGFSRAELETAFPLYQIERFSSSQIILARTVSGCCEQHYILKLLDESTLGVQQFSPDEGVMRETMQIAIDPERMGEDMKNDLRLGVVFYDMDAVNTYLESMES